MFYSKFMFVKKGPLSKVWIAAHFHRKLTKTHVQGTDINLSAKSILDPTTPLALRLSGQLLLGLVRIYQRKVKYLQEDCSDALTKMKSVLQKGVVDLPAENAVAAVAQITFAERDMDMLDMMPDQELGMQIDDLIEADLGAGDLTTSVPTYSVDANDITMNGEELNLGSIDMENLGSIDIAADDLLQDNHLFGDDMLANADDLFGADQQMDLNESVEQGRDREDEVSVGRTSINLEGDEILKTPASDRSKEGLVGLEDLDTTDGTMGAMDDSTVGGPVTPLAPPLTPIAPSTPLPESQSQAGGKEEEEEEEEEELRVAPAKKKRKVMKVDRSTELAGSVISEGLRNFSDIVQEREPIPMTKRATVQAHWQKIGFASLLQRPALGGHNIEEGHADGLAPELLAFFKKIQRLGPVDVEWQAEELEEEEEAKDKEAEEDKSMEGTGKEQLEDETQMQIDQEGLPIENLDNLDNLDPLDQPMDQLPLPEEPNEFGNSSFDGQSMVTDTTDGVTPAGKRTPYRELDIDGESTVLGPDSVGDLDDETQGGWSRRTRKMHQVLGNRLKTTDKLSYESIVAGTSRKDAAVVFYELLVLKTHNFVSVEQPVAYGDITISKANFRQTLPVR